MTIKTNANVSGAWYSLRRTLVPWDFDNALQDLLDYCRAVPIDEIIIKCDTEEFSHGHPSIAWLEAYQPRLHQVRRALAELGVVYSLNPWVTVGHCDRGRDVRAAIPGIRTQIGHRGERTRAQACPLCPVWRKHVGALWTLYAQTHPAVIWVEDDIRTFNHNPAHYGCFCEEHLRRFSVRVGKDVSREELGAALFQPGEPHLWRREWLLMQRDVMNDTVAFLGDTIRAVSPDTVMGLMSSGPENHVLCGREWTAFAHALGGGGAIYSRPPLGNYSETSLRGLYYTARQVRATRLALPADTVEQTEVENWWFTQYSKSVAFTRLQIATCLLLGADGLTMNLYDHVGTPLATDATMGNMLREEKPFFHGISARCRGKSPCGGVRILQHHDSGMFKKIPQEGSVYRMADDGYHWDEFLESLGIATTWDTSSPVTAVSGQVLRAFSDAEITALFRGGVLLDLTAVEVMHERGLGHLTGVYVKSISARNDWSFLAAEEWHNPDFGGALHTHMTMTYPTLSGDIDLAELSLAEGTMAVSRLINADREVMAPFLCVCENALGGRTAVFPTHLNEGGGSLLNPIRQRQFSILMDWLARGALPLLVTAHAGVYPLPVRRDFPTHTVLGAINLSLDPWRGITFDWFTHGRVISEIHLLNSSGKWEKADETPCQKGVRASITLKREVCFAHPVVLDVIWA